MRARSGTAVAAIGALLLSTGCVRRVVNITSEPSGATVWLNDREIGRTPCSAEFTYYGTYDVRMQLDGYEPVQGSAEAVAPLFDTVGIDFVSELLPAKLVSTNDWHFTLTVSERDDAALLARARELRVHTEVAPAAPPAPDAPAEATVPEGSRAPVPDR